jgi:nucleotide-binding universal stress UspA family protein
MVALDFSEDSQKILECISDIPGVEEVLLFHVVNAARPSIHGWTYDPDIENARLRLSEKKEYLENLGLTVRTGIDVIVDVITQGSVPEAIVDAATSHKASLLVIGARGMNPIGELLLGSVATSIIHNATTNVLIVRPGPAACAVPAGKRSLFSSILVPTDFSGPANDTLSSLRTLEGIKRIVLMHVVSRAETREEIEEGIRAASSRLDAMKQDLVTAGIPATSHVRVGDPTEMILSVAEEDDVTLVAMSAYGTGWLRSVLLGSTVFTVTRRTRRSVLLLRSDTPR